MFLIVYTQQFCFVFVYYIQLKHITYTEKAKNQTHYNANQPIYFSI